MSAEKGDDKWSRCLQPCADQSLVWWRKLADKDDNHKKEKGKTKESDTKDDKDKKRK